MRFGDFDYDRASGELSGPTGVTRLAPQVASLLGLLLDRAGEVVTRAELHDALWPNTTVEFDQGLNFCVRQLRMSLGDEADRPRYIETLPKRGYRFIAPGVTPAHDPPIRERSPAPRNSRLLPAIAAAVIIVLVAVALAVRASRRSPSLGLAVLTFDAPQGDSALASYADRLVEDIVAAATREHAGDLVVMGPSFTRRFPGTRADPDSVGAALGASHLLSGTLARDSAGVRIFAQLIRLSDRRHVMALRFSDSFGGRREIADSIEHRAANVMLGGGSSKVR